MMRCYRIEVVKDVGGEVVRLPVLTMQGRTFAMDKFERVVLDEYNELNSDMMRIVGGRSEVYLYRSDNILLDGELVKHVTVKRPLHSPSASVHRL